MTAGRCLTRAVATAMTAVCLLAGTAACGSSSSSTAKESATSSKTQKKSSKKPVTQAPSLKKKQGTKKAAPQKSTTDTTTGTTAQNTSQRGAMCGTDELTARITQGAGAGAGSSYPYLVLTNKGNRTCLERGYPGVSLQAGGRQIGAAANRDTSVAPVSVWLKPGQSAHSELQVVNADAYDGSSCSAQTADSVLVFPPDQTASISIPVSGYKGCKNMSITILRVRPLQPGQE